MKCSACSPYDTMGLTATCGKPRSSLCARAARHRAKRAAGTAVNPVWTLGAESTLCGGIDATRALAARSVESSRGAGDCSLRRGAQPTEHRSSADPGSHAKLRATERTTSQSYRRTPTSIATYSVSRNPELTPPRHRPRCELRAEPRFVEIRSRLTEKRALRHVSAPPEHPGV